MLCWLGNVVVGFLVVLVVVVVVVVVVGVAVVVVVVGTGCLGVVAGLVGALVESGAPVLSLAGGATVTAVTHFLMSDPMVMWSGQAQVYLGERWLI